MLIQRKAEAGFYNLNRTDLTFEALAVAWLHSLQNSIKESTYAYYSYTLHKYLLPILSKVPVTSLEESFLEQAMQQIIAPVDATHKPLGNPSARECLSMLRRICKYAAHLRLIRPMELEVALPKAIDKISAPLSPAEQQRLHQYVQANPTPRKIGLLLGLELGLRIGEICGLQWGDFDLKLGTLKINRTVCRISCGNGHTKVVIQTPKTRTSRREIPIPNQLLIMLKKLRGKASNAAWFLSGSESMPTEPRCYRKSIKGNHSNFSITQMEDAAFSIPLFLQKGTQLLYFMLKDPCLRKGRGPIFS
ncbi:site-specific integrase [Faecalibacterium prausnitzii]|uniref:site-specific integrase n=1 Tax=Faecalibacterium prausnitzii TaxID=853 RepID=UPI001FA88391|nr:site-specific integrase [Faecalibacterium prausnitzii]